MAGVERALAEAEAMLGGGSLVGHLTDPTTGVIVPITLVTDNGGPFRSFRFEHFIAVPPRSWRACGYAASGTGVAVVCS